MKLRIIVATLFIVLAGAACGQNPDSDSAAATFAECLERNGIVAENIRVTVSPDGSVETVEVAILKEAEVAYEPTVRLLCTEEVENE